MWHIEAELTDTRPPLNLDVDVVRRFRHQDQSIAPELGRTYLDYALMLEARGRADELSHVQRFTHQARTIFANLGMLPFLHRADDLLQRLRPSAPEAPQESRPRYAKPRGERVASILNRVSQTRPRFLA